MSRRRVLAAGFLANASVRREGGRFGGGVFLAIAVAAALVALGGCASSSSPEAAGGPVTPRYSVLVFTKTDTAGYRHASIPDGIQAIRELGAEHYFSVDATEDASVFTADSLQRYDAVVFLSTSGDVLDDAQQGGLEQYVRAGGGFAGVHGAAATEYEWAWYGGLVGAFFDDHPSVQEARVNVANGEHPSTLHLPAPWVRTDEWYNFRTNPADSVNVLLTLDEGSYEGGTMGEDHPIAWMREYDGGRSFYTGLGHTKEAFGDPLFREHLLEGIEWAAGGLDGFVEPGFPFITTTVDAGGIAPHLPGRNMAVRGVVLQLGNGAYACFDPDLLRMSVGWTGDFLSLSTMAQVSYQEAKNKDNGIPRVQGQPVFGTGLYPGWAGAEPQFEDPRPAGPNPNDPGRGPLSTERGRWRGVHLAGSTAVLSYVAEGTGILEQPGSVQVGSEVGITRSFETQEATARPLTLVAAEVPGGTAAEIDGNVARVAHGAAGDSVTAVGVVGMPEGAQLASAQDRYVTLRLPEGTEPASFEVVLWSGAQSELDAFRQMLQGPVTVADVSADSAGSVSHWPRAVRTRGAVAPDTSAFVNDELSLPLPNPWDRNVRVADLDFFSDGRAAVVTFSGDVWLLSGIDQTLEELRWKRFASGLYEPLSLSIVEGDVYVYGREGIVRLNDQNGDGEADFYENFSDLIVQSSETREWPLDMVARPEGGFFLSMGGALNAGPETGSSQKVVKGFRLGSRHAGTITAVSADGRSIDVYASGFREPYLGAHPRTGALTASDQQGNFVPSTPVYAIREGGFYGVPPTAQSKERPLPEPVPPLTWIPHTADPSGASQVWVDSDQMGPLSGALLHLSYARPGPFRVYADTTQGTWQGGALPLPGDYDVPTMKGQVHPGDGQLYMGGFQIFQSKAEKISSLIRMRYTGQPSAVPAQVHAGQQGVLLRFEQALDPASATQAANYAVRRWNYQRTEQYGSGHFTLDGSTGEETLQVAAAHLSEDRKAVFLVLPDMQPVMQMQVEYTLRSAQDVPIEGPLYLTMNEAPSLELADAGFEGVDWQGDLERAPEALAARASPSEAEQVVSARRGRHIYQEIGCVTCHSLDGTQQGKVGPSFQGLHGSERPLEGGGTVTADDDYIRQSIWEPSSQIVEGYGAGMPAYRGVLSDAEVESLVQFIESLSTSSESLSASSNE